MNDQLMMQEILELLATDISNQKSIQASSNDENSNNSSAVAEFKNSHGSNLHNYEVTKLAGTCSDKTVPKLMINSIKESSSGNSNIEEEEKNRAEHTQEPNIMTRRAANEMQMQNSKARPLVYEGQPLAAKISHSPPQQFCDGHSRINVSSSSEGLPSAPTTVSMPVAPPASSVHQSSPAGDKKKSQTSSVVSTCPKIHVMNAAEFDDLRRKLRMQTASRRYRKRKKQSRQLKVKVQLLQAELARFQMLESQSKQYQERSVESLHNELQTHEDEVCQLSQKVQEAAKVESDWIKTMSGYLRK